MASPPRRRLFSASAFIRNGAVYKGFLGGSRGWTIVGTVYFVGRFIKRSLGRQEEIAATEALPPGHRLLIEAIPMRTRADRRRAAATAPVVRRRAS